MAKWTAFPHDADAYTYDAGDAEEEVGAPARRRRRAAAEGRQGARRLGAVPRRRVPEGDRGRAEARGGARRMTVANKAQAIYANYLEKSEKTKLALLLEVAERAEKRSRTRSRRNANAWYCMAYALGRYSQGISIAKALAQGLGSEGEERARDDDQARAQARRRAHRARRLPRRGDRQGRLAARPHARARARTPAWRMYKTALKLNPTLGDRDGRIRQRPGHARRRQADEGSDQALRGRRRLRAAGRDGAARRRDGEGRAGGLVPLSWRSTKRWLNASERRSALPRVTERRMFGGLAFMLEGKMFVGISGSG